MPEVIHQQQRTMQRPGEGIVHATQPTQEHQEYPKHMRHPGFAPAEIGQKVKFGDPEGPGFTYNQGGKPARYPPVLVHHATDEEHHKSLGYVVVGKSSAEAFLKAVQSNAPPIENHVAVEYPKWVNGKLVHSAEEEAKLTGQPMPGSSEAASDAPAVNTEVNTPVPAGSRVEQPISDDDEIAALEARLASIRAKKADMARRAAELKAEIAAELDEDEDEELRLKEAKPHFVSIPETDTHIGHVEFVPVAEETVVLDTGETVRRPAADQLSDGAVVEAAQAAPVDEKAARKKARSDAIKAGLAKRKADRAAKGGLPESE